MRIGLDFDGVISDCGDLKCKAAKRMYGVDIPSSRFKKELVVGGGILTYEQYRQLQDTIYGTREYGMLMEPVTGVIEGIGRLRQDGHELRVITSRDGEMLDVAREWATRRGLSIEFTGVGHGASKAGAAEGLDLYVDDDLDKLEPLVGIVPHRVLFSWGYNAHIDVRNVASRVASWEELVGKVTALVPAR